MAVAQPGIFAQGTRSHYQLELDLRPGAAPADVVVALRGLREPSVTAGGANVVVGLGPDLARRLELPGGVPDAGHADSERRRQSGISSPDPGRKRWRS